MFGIEEFRKKREFERKVDNLVSDFEKNRYSPKYISALNDHLTKYIELLKSLLLVYEEGNERRFEVQIYKKLGEYKRVVAFIVSNVLQHNLREIEKKIRKLNSFIEGNLKKFFDNERRLFRERKPRGHLFRANFSEARLDFDLQKEN